MDEYVINIYRLLNIGYKLYVPIHDMFDSLSPEINLILPSLDIVGPLWRCLLKPIFIPSSYKSSETKPEYILAPKITRVATGVHRQPSVKHAKKSLSKLKTERASSPFLSKKVTSERVTSYTAGTKFSTKENCTLNYIFTIHLNVIIFLLEFLVKYLR